MQWPPLSPGDYERLRRFEFRCERAWDDDPQCLMGLLGG